jgi:micrococcal nuclease
MIRLAALALGLSLLGSAAQADPCKAISDSGQMPSFLKPGATFTGPVVYVGDGDSLCVAVGQGPPNWVEVRLSDFYAPELHSVGGVAAKRTLSHLSMGQRVVCHADHRSYDRVVSQCFLKGVSLGDLMRSAGVLEGGNH